MTAGTTLARDGTPSSWPLWLLAAPAFVAVWSGWVGLARLCGFGVVEPLPGIWDDLRLDTSITLPIGLEAYAAYALRVWLSTDTSPRAVMFARRSTLLALALGSLGQVVYHLLTASGVSTAPWPVTAVVAVLPVAVFGMGAALAHLVQHDRPAVDGHHPAQPRQRVVSPGLATDATSVLATKAVTAHKPASATRTRRRPASGADTAGRVAALIAEDPETPAAAIATRLGVSERTARRHRAAVLAGTPATNDTAHSTPDSTSKPDPDGHPDHERTDADTSTKLEGSAA